MGTPVRAEFVTTQLEEILTAYVRRHDGLPMTVIAEGLITAIDDLIQSEGNHEWKEFNPDTLKRHPKRRGGLLLQDTGLLAQIQQTPASPGPDWVEVESPAPYAIFHVSRAPRKIIPLRDFLDINMPKVLDDIGDQILSEIDQ